MHLLQPGEISICHTFLHQLQEMALDKGCKKRARAPECPASRMIAVLKPWEEEKIKIAKKQKKDESKEERERTARVFKNANLILLHEKTAAIALAPRGIGPETASRVIGN